MRKRKIGPNYLILIFIYDLVPEKQITCTIKMKDLSMHYIERKISINVAKNKYGLNTEGNMQYFTP